jgi:RNA polymerase sigma-70 factor (ECF subfamily)
MSQLLAAVRRDGAPSDEDLVLDLARGRHDALGALYSRYAGLIFAVAAQSLGPTAAEEVVQETFLAIWRGASTFDPAAGPFRPWALRVAHWRILNELRRRRRHPGQGSAEDEHSPLLHLADAEPGPEEHVWRGERARLVHSALSNLSPKQRQAVALAFMQDLTHEQVADVLGVPLGTAKTRIRDGLQHMRTLLLPVAASLVLVAVLGAGLVRWLQHESALRQNQRAVTVLTSSTVVAIRVPSVTGSDMHALYRVEPGTDLVILSVSHAEPGPYQARAHVAGQWVPLGTFQADADGRAVLIAQAEALGQVPDALEVRLESTGQLVLQWAAP